MKSINKFITFLLSLSIILICGNNVKAFQPVSHYVIIEKASKNLSDNSIIRKSIENYPNIAAWGSVGPDLGYMQVGQLGNYSPWADRYHYYKVGSYASTQLKNALQSGDMKKIAFAAGWVSHISGDLACHGIYVNPECGVYLDNINGRKMHAQMEKEAEPYAWVNIGGHSINDYNSTNIPNNIFKNVDSIPFDLMNATSQQIYGTSPSVAEEKLWAKTLFTGFKTGIGYNYVNYNESKQFLSNGTREERLKNAFNEGEDQCYKLLSYSEAGDYSKFTDRWNLDVGRSNSPISSLTAIITTGTKLGAGTDDDIYFGIHLKSGEKKEWLLDKQTYNDFENGACDEYYLYINNVDFMPKMVDNVWIRKNPQVPLVQIGSLNL
ncbi:MULTISPECIES: zinc dependent phospholipase C family protein [Clostridium]|uniref:zinc dependent phospholipase C family protein n=1 Tax=Clostridium TaxID=1485 RepID=UPI000ABD42B0|nr:MULTISPECIES: zinc dependent phospholipase C family protein [Clostridium]